MPTFFIEITETLYREIPTEANSVEEAMEIVRTKYGEAEIVLDNDDFIGADFTFRGETNREETRICSECNATMSSGFVAYGGEKYFCSDECRKKTYDDKTWSKLCSCADADSYYTEWL